MKIFTLIIDHRHGMNVSTFSTYDKAFLDLIEYVKENMTAEKVEELMDEPFASSPWINQYMEFTEESYEIFTTSLNT